MKFEFPGVRIIDRYIIRKFLGTYVFAIALIIVVVVIFDAAEKIDDFIELKAPLSKIVFQYYLNFIPFFVNQFSGLFTFIAVIFFTSKMAYQTEIIAILSSGVSFRRMMWPYFISALVIAIASLLLNLFVIPISNHHRTNFETKYLKMFQNTNYDQHIFRQVDAGTFAYIRDYNGETNGASFFALEKHENNTVVSSIEAAEAVFNPETKRWSAPKYIERSFENGNEKYAVKEKLDTLINLNTTELGRVEMLIKAMNINQLNRFIVEQREKGSDQLGLFEVERQQRYAYPVSTFILTLIGVSLSSRKVRGGTGLHIGVGIGLCFSYILFSKFAEEFAKSGVLNPMLSLWLPNMIYLLIGLYLYKRAPK